MKKLALPILMATLSSFEFSARVYIMLSKNDLDKKIPVAIVTGLGVLFFLLSIIFAIQAFSCQNKEDEEAKTEN